MAAQVFRLGEPRALARAGSIIYSGVIAFVFFVIAFIAIIAGLDFRVHKIAGILAFVFACVQVGLIIYRQLKLKKK